MPAAPTPAQSAASRLNGARSYGPTTPEGKQRAARNAVRHGLSGKTFHLLADEDPEEFARHAADWHRDLAPRDTLERDAVETILRAAWRQYRAERLEVSVLDAIFSADGIADPAEAAASRMQAMRGLSTLLRYRSQIGREFTHALSRLEELRRRRPEALEQMRDEPEGGASAAVRNEPNARATAIVRNEPNAPAVAPVRNEPNVPATRASAVRNEPNALAALASSAVRDEPEPSRKLNRHQRRALAARARQRVG